jgi:hypothetical protein
LVAARGFESAFAQLRRDRASDPSVPNRAVSTDILHLSARVVVTATDGLSSADARIVLAELSAVRERPMISCMPTTARPQRRYDHRLRNLVQRTGDATVATNLGVPRSTARGWLGATPTLVVCLDVADLIESELRQEVLKLRRRVEKLTALLRFALTLLRPPGLASQERACRTDAPRCWILRAVDRAREYLPLRVVLRFLRVSPSRFHAWRRRQRACALDDQSSCPRTSPYRLTRPEVRAIQDMVTSPDSRHVPTCCLTYAFGNHEFASYLDNVRVYSYQ